MLDSLNIKGYKLFEDLRVPRLARMNLIVGGNSAGKSCFLEAVRLLTTNGSIAVIRDLIRARDSDWEASLSNGRVEPEDGFASSYETPLRFLFHDFHCQNVPNAEIVIGPDDPQKVLKLSLGLYRTTRAEDGSFRRVRVEQGDDQVSEDSSEMLEVSLGGDRHRVVGLDSLWRRSVNTRSYLADDLPAKSTVGVGTNGIGGEEVGYLWDQISLTPMQDRVLDCLRLIERDIEGIAMIGDANRPGNRQRIPVIRLRGNKERLPLKTMGDGLTRLFHIALAVVNAQNGVVLIDEFENGLYWEVQEELWPLLFKLADDCNAQVFVTTHSQDCLRSFVNAWEVVPSSGAVYRIERNGEWTSATAMPMANVSDALASQVEVR